MIYKKLNQKEKIFHYIEISPTNVILFDSDIDIPLIDGSKVKVANFIRNKLNKNVRINYYDIKNDYINITKIYDKRKAT